MKSEVLSFRKIIAANTEVYLSERLKDGGNINRVKVRFYPGQQKSLIVRPYVLHKGQRQEDVLTYVNGTDNFLSGDDDQLEFPVFVQVELDDEFIVYAKNTDLANSYSLVCDVFIEYDTAWEGEV